MFLFLLLFLASTFYLFQFYHKAKKLPPGPIPLPLIGNFHQLAWNLYFEKTIVNVMQKWQKEYGDVFTWWLGGTAIVNICEYEIAIDAMIKKGANFSSRPYDFFLDIMREGKGLLFSSGQHWEEQRRFSLYTFRNFGVGRNFIQDRIMLEYEYRSETLNKQLEAAGGLLNVDLYNFIELTVGNVINSMLFSKRFTEDAEKRFFKLKKEMDELFENSGLVDFLIAEWSYNIPPFKQRWETILGSMNKIIDFISEQIEQRKVDIAAVRHELRDEGEDFVDAFLIEIQKKDHGRSFEEHSLKMTLLDLWIAGQETTTSTLYWALNYLILHPDEILRVSSIAAINIWREAENEVTVGSHRIPKGAFVTAQLSVMMADKKIFPESEKFKPERFMEPGLEQYVTPFGLGKRACLGESLARAEIYLIFGNLVLNYDFSHEDHR